LMLWIVLMIAVNSDCICGTGRFKTPEGSRPPDANTFYPRNCENYVFHLFVSYLLFPNIGDNGVTAERGDLTFLFVSQPEVYLMLPKFFGIYYFL